VVKTCAPVRILLFKEPKLSLSDGPPPIMISVLLFFSCGMNHSSGFLQFSVMFSINWESSVLTRLFFYKTM